MSTETAAPGDLEQLAAAADRAAREVQGLPDEARDKGLALQRAVEAFHKAGLARIVRSLKADPRGTELLFELVGDPLVRALLLRHGLVRPPLFTRVQQVIESARPYVQGHGGDVELAEVRGATAVVRLQGAGGSCSATAGALLAGLEEAVRQRVPEIEKVEAVPDAPAPVLLPLGLPPRAAAARDGFQPGPRVEEVPVGRPYGLEVGGVPVLILRLGGDLAAFRNACAHQGLPLDGAMVDEEAGTLACPWHGFRFDGRTGECLTAPGAQLESFAVRVEDGVIWVRPT